MGLVSFAHIVRQCYRGGCMGMQQIVTQMEKQGMTKDKTLSEERRRDINKRIALLRWDLQVVTDESTKKSKEFILKALSKELEELGEGKATA